MSSIEKVNGEPLSIAQGAPLRLRLERQLGYKMNKYIESIELVESFKSIGGKGDYWEDLATTGMPGFERIYCNPGRSIPCISGMPRRAKDRTPRRRSRSCEVRQLPATSMSTLQL
jgi:DMSO/TMAO reductase YedYZ molybdopterin-dependent catalytic subunit